MLKFLKTLFELRKNRLTFLMWEDAFPDEPQSYSFIPLHMFVFFGAFGLAVMILIGSFLYVTPAGNLIFNKKDAEIRENLIEISARILVLQDSLKTRDEQLENMKAILRDGVDTSFVVGPIRRDVHMPTVPSEVTSPLFDAGTIDFLREPDVRFTSDFARLPVFPTELPVRGSITQTYKPEVGHFGIDIAASVGTPFRTIADGVVVSTEWSINFGYVIQVQHADGFLSIFKHCSIPFRKTGDIIQKGDILGTISDTGVLSSGPHLHFELWRNGQPLNPLNYTID